MIQTIIALTSLEMVLKLMNPKVEKVDKTPKTKVVYIGTKIRISLILVDSIREVNLEKGNTAMILVLVVVGRNAIEETMMTIKMIETTLKIKDIAGIGQTDVTLILKLLGKFGLVHLTEKLGRAIS